MGIKRCPSFSKRPGFPCGLRVLLVDADNTARVKAENLLKECSYTVTPCSTTVEALACLTSGNTYDVLLADESMVCGKTRDRHQLLDSCKGLPCILMAQDPSPQEILSGIQLGAVDFLAKPLSPLKLQNIWQHTVRKMMSNMNINCTSPAPAAEPAEPAVAAAAATAAVKKELDEMEIIMEEPEAELAAVTDIKKGQSNSKAAADSAGQRALKVKESVPNAALAAASSFFEPTKCLSRSTSLATADSTATVACVVAPDSPAKTSGSQQPKKHAPVHSCSSTRSLNSMASCYSNLQVAMPESPSATEGTDDLAGQPSVIAVDTPASSPRPQQQQQRCMKKAVRHPTPATPASKPPLGKPQHSSQQHKAGICMLVKGSALGPCSGATAAGPLPVNIGMTSVPLPTGLGPLPQGMVWGMPMCPLARAPGIVPPKAPASGSASTGSLTQRAATAAGSSATASGAMGMPPMGMAWGMMGMPPMGMPMGMPSPFMAGFVMPPMPLGMPFGPFGGPNMSGFAGQPAFEPQQMQMAGSVPAAQQDAAAAAAAPVPLEQMPQTGTVSTGAAAAAALNASWNADGCLGTAEDPATGMDLNEAFDFMLGDITAEDDLDVGMSGLLDGELAQLEKDGLKLPTELQELQACQQQEELQQLQQQQQQRASMDCSTLSRHNSSQRISFDGHSHARQRVSFDCSTASTATAGRLSFDCSSGNPSSRPAKSQRVSFEVNCPAGKPTCNITTQGSMTAPQTGKVCSPAIAAYEQSADALLGSMSDLFAACSSDSCSEEGSNGMITDLHGLFGAPECANDEGCSTAAAAAGLFNDVMDDLPLELAMKKSSSLAELLNAGLPPMHA